MDEPLRSLTARIGDTPLIPLASPVEGVRLLGKAEWLNPGGSVKDRPAWSIVRRGLTEGHLPDRRLLDASSGNTAIAYAMLAAAGSFGTTLCVPETASRERVRTLRAYGAEVVLTDGAEGSDGAIRRAREMADDDPDRFWYADQYGNPANPESHYETTGPEIWRDTAGSVTHLVAGLGTTGTLVGTGRFLRERREDVRIVGVEPAGPLHGIEGLKHLETAVVPPVFEPSLVDERVPVETEAAQEATRRLARATGLFVGVSSGAAFLAARRVAEELERGTVVLVLPDGGGRYLDEEWWNG